MLHGPQIDPAVGNRRRAPRMLVELIHRDKLQFVARRDHVGIAIGIHGKQMLAITPG